MMAFLTEPAPVYGQAVTVAPGVRRIVAANPGPMTYHGTNTYLLDGEGGISVLDPGPNDAAHLAAVLRGAGAVRRILLSHGHVDHVAGLAAMRAATGAEVFAFAAACAPDRRLSDGGDVAGWTAIHTPGHAPDHLCFARGDGVVLSADHVMGWSTSMVSPPDGDMTAYLASLRRMLARTDRLYLPGHGPPIAEPAAHVRFLLDHRLAREAALLAMLGPAPLSTAGLTGRLYGGLAGHLLPAAERNVRAHLLKLEADGLALGSEAGWAIRPPRHAPAG